MANLNQLSIKQTKEGLRNKQFSSQDITQDCLSQIKKTNQTFNSFLYVNEDQAMEQAKLADDRLSKNESVGSLTGIPLALKDNMLVQGLPATAGSKILEKYHASYDAKVTKIFKDQGAVILGKTNMDEFAMGSSNENSAYGKVKNPWNVDKVPGGSSGGSAVAVSLDQCLAALGSDTGGSIRLPASFCGVVGIKPTYGTVSRFGLMAMASSLDQIGTFGKTVEDAAIVLQEIMQPDERDSTCFPENKSSDLLKDLDKDIKGLKIGVPKQYFVKGMDENVEKTVRQAIAKLEELGAKIIKIDLPYTEYALAVYYIIMTAEVSSNMARYDGMRYGDRDPNAQTLIDLYLRNRDVGLGDEVKRRCILGTFVLSAGYHDAYYKKAQKVRNLIKNDFVKAFEKVDCIASPTSPSVAFNLGEKFSDPLTMYLADIFTVSLNIAGLPGVSVPCGFVDNMPVGMQLIGNYFDEATILRVANNFEKNNDFASLKPEINLD